MISPGSYQRPGFSTLHLPLLTLIVRRMRRQIKTLSVLRPRRGGLSVLYWGRHDRPSAGAPIAVGPGALPPSRGVRGRAAVSRRPGDPPGLELRTGRRAGPRLPRDADPRDRVLRACAQP